MVEVYVSTDVETDGPIPGPHSMLSIASAALLPDRGVVSTFSATLETLPDATAHPRTMAFWAQNAQAYAAATRDPHPPGEVMARYAAWLGGLPGTPVFVGYPAAWDFSFVHWYLVRFTGNSPFSHAALDIKTLAMALLRRPYRECTKSRFPVEWTPKQPHTHEALDDALEQGELFLTMLRELHAGPPRRAK